MALPSSVESLMLVVLLRGPAYGGALCDRVAAIDPTFRPTPSALYPALQRLEDAGLATAKDVPPPADRGGRPRRVYSLTAKGRRRALQLARFFGQLASSTTLEAA